MKWRWNIAQAAEIRWWRNYLKDKPKEDYLAAKSHYWGRVLGTLGLDLPADSRILDAGCGPAGIFMALPQQQVDAIDPLLDAYRSLPHFAPERYPHVRFSTVSLEDFCPSQPYDTVFCLNAINHVADLGRSMDTLVAATRKGGTLVVSIDAHNHAWLKPIFQLIPGDILHPHQYDLREYSEMLSARGCQLQASHLLKKGGIFNYYALVFTKA